MNVKEAIAKLMTLPPDLEISRLEIDLTGDRALVLPPCKTGPDEIQTMSASPPPEEVGGQT